MSTKTILSFDVLYNKSSKEVANFNASRVRSKNVRAFESGIENLEDQIEDQEDKLQKVLQVVTKGEIVDVTAVAKIKAEIRKLQNGVEDLKAVQKEFFSTAKTTRGKGREIQIVDTEDTAETAE